MALRVVYKRAEPSDNLIAELPGILNWALEGHRRLMENGGFKHEPLPFENQEKWERYGNSIEQWLDRFTEKDPDAATPKWNTDAGTLGAYDSYKAFAQRNGLAVETDQKFTAEVKHREGVSKRKPPIDGQRCQAYRGFRLTDDAPTPEHEKADDDSVSDATGIDEF